ncbi:GAF and ANTAR domain-containing protein (plasmid) [Rhodococcus sp. DMU1]|nr:GAF and ANTAR domain-containing protein [Rhodococcus sp. DMU1]
MSAPATADPVTVFTALAEILYQSDEPAQAYAALCLAATMLVPGCDHASMMLRDGRAHVTVAATDDIAYRVDSFERATGEGPCLDALDDDSAQLEADLRAGSRWPRLAAAVLEHTPVRGMMGFRLLVDQRKVGAVNLFSDTPGAFTADAAASASVLAAFTSVTVTAVTRGDDIASLRAGLTSNREIGKAVGLLMGLERLSEDEAFDLLRRTSQDMNIKVADLARRIVDPHRNGHRD